jgi:hypothetical protein
MARYILYGLSNCTDPAREDEFINWYKTMRQADMLKLPHVKSVRLSKLKNFRRYQGQPQFLAIYEIESDDIGKDSLEIQSYVNKLNETRGTTLFKLVSGGYYGVINYHSK